MQKRLIALAILAASASVSSQADIVGATAGAYMWKQSWDGDVKAGSQSIDMNDDLGYDDETGKSFYVALEHPVPVLPNIRLQHTALDISETNTLNRSFTFDGKGYLVGEEVDSTTDLTHTDGTFYYEILDNWVNLDVGLTVRMFDGEVSIRGASGEGSIEIDAPLPMAYVNARFELPLTGFYASALGNVIAYGDNKVTDMTLALGYELGILGLELGYRNFDVQLEDDNEEANVTVDGYFLGVVIDI
ncbi:TIGR04219 family outer membrane beta-barrel protein [Zhongshania sp.]|jgi:outer membrane protein|uniref:TIGR04219 family outer membrane beta-barrel protein n=1 Tax=Zhongshania sp. TaxID=1971902 RepID=UPI002A82E1EE|nr:TIGR04219 family outer membrane beta-barrel protein [Zhongshania sp.]